MSEKTIVESTLINLSCTLLLVFLFAWQVSSTNPGPGVGSGVGSGSGSGLPSGSGTMVGVGIGTGTGTGTGRLLTDEEYNDNNSNRAEDIDYYNEGDLMAKRHMGSIAASSGVRSSSPLAARLTGGYYGDNGLKFKRFLGTLARGGWFPRQFRGYVYPSPMGSGFQQKRHIGSVARLGWLPLRDDNMQF